MLLSIQKHFFLRKQTSFDSYAIISLLFDKLLQPSFNIGRCMIGSIKLGLQNLMINWKRSQRNGMFTNFLKFGLEIRVVYRNTGDQTGKFQFFHNQIACFNFLKLTLLILMTLVTLLAYLHFHIFFTELYLSAQYYFQ